MGLLDKMNGLSMSAGANGSSDSVKENDLPARDEFIQVKKDALSLIIYELNKNTQSELNEDHVRKVISDVLERENPSVSRPDRAKIGNELYNDIMGYGPIDSLLSDPDVTEIMVNGPNKIFYEKRGRIQRSELCFRDNDHVMNIIDRIVSGVGRHIDEASPMVDARLADGSRVNAVIPPISLVGPVITIRKFSQKPFSAQNLIEFHSVTQNMVSFLEACVKGKLNVVVSGGTGSGKTTLLNVLSSFIPENERIGDSLTIMSNCLRSGLSLQQAMVSISKEMPEPISKEFSRVLREIKYGSTIEDALNGLVDRIKSKDLELMVSAILIQRQVGGNLSEILNNISSTILSRIKIQNDIKVMTATGRVSGIIIGLLPLGVGLILMVLNPEYFQVFFETQLGIGLLVLCALMEGIGFFCISKIIKIDY